MFHNCAKAFEDIEIGDEAEFDVTIDINMHEGFSKLIGDYSPIHMDEAFALSTQFNKNIGYGFLLEGLLSRLYGEYLPGGSSICIKQESKFIKPYFVGDNIKVKAKVINKIYSTKFVEIQTSMYRDGEQCIYRGKGLVQVLYSYEMFKPLYETDEGYLYYSDFKKKLKSLGIEKGDTIFVHSDIATFGRLATKDRAYLLKSLTDVLKESVGKKGSLIMPTFTYSFCNGEIFDLEKSRSTVGVLTEYFRNQPGVKRSVQPIFSCAVCGDKAEELSCVSKDSFGEDSIFDKLRKHKGKLVFFGADFHSCTYIHYLEQSFNVPYRYIKKFKGKIKNGDNEYEDEYSFYVRDLEKNVILDTARLEEYLLEKGFMNKVSIGHGSVLLVDADTLYQEGHKLLESDINYFLRK